MAKRYIEQAVEGGKKKQERKQYCPINCDSVVIIFQKHKAERNICISCCCFLLKSISDVVILTYTFIFVLAVALMNIYFLADVKVCFIKLFLDLFSGIFHRYWFQGYEKEDKHL